MRKRFGKILTAVMVMAIALSMMQFSAFASESDTNATATPAVEATGAAATPGAYKVEVALYLMEANDNWSFGKEKPKTWSEPKSESVFIKEDGTYTFSLKDLDIPSDKFMLCYLKDVAAYPKGSKVTHSNVPDNVMIITDELRVNGSKKEVNNKVRTGLKKGIFDICYHNNWDDNDNSVIFDTTVNTIDVTITVTGITGKPGAIKFEPTKSAATPTIAAAETVGNADPDTTNNKSGNVVTIIIGLAAALVIAVVLIVVIGKKKKAK